MVWIWKLSLPVLLPHTNSKLSDFSDMYSLNLSLNPQSTAFFHNHKNNKLSRRILYIKYKSFILWAFMTVGSVYWNFPALSISVQSPHKFLIYYLNLWKRYISKFCRYCKTQQKNWNPFSILLSLQTTFKNMLLKFCTIQAPISGFECCRYASRGSTMLKIIDIYLKKMK